MVNVKRYDNATNSALKEVIICKLTLFQLQVDQKTPAALTNYYMVCAYLKIYLIILKIRLKRNSHCLIVK